MFYFFPGRGKIEAFAMGILVAFQAMGFDVIGGFVIRQTVLHGFCVIFHDTQFFEGASRAVTDFTRHAFLLQLLGFVGKRAVADKAFWTLGRIFDAAFLGDLLGLVRR